MYGMDDTSKPLKKSKSGVTKMPGFFNYEVEFARDNAIVQQQGHSDVPISEPLMDISSHVSKELQKGYYRVAQPKERKWTPSDTDGTRRKGPWRPKGASKSYRQSSRNNISRRDRGGPGGTNGY